MASTINDDGFSILSGPSTNPNIPSPLARASISSADTASRLPESNPSSDDHSYDGILWEKLNGFQIPPPAKRERWSWILSHGYQVECTRTGVIYWVCKPCLTGHVHKVTKYIFTTTGNQKRHLKTHSIYKPGTEDTSNKRQRPLSWVPNDNPERQAIHNTLARSLNKRRFQVAMMRWVVHNNIAFYKVESKYFRAMMLEANSGLDDAGLLPTADTIRSWIIADYEGYKGVVTELLLSVNRLIHFSFDLWRSSNIVSLNGVVCHFLDSNFKLRTFLLSIPELTVKHSGVNIAETVSAIIYEFSLQDRVGYFVSDNAFNNDSCLNALSIEFNFNPTHRRIRCGDHMIQLSAKQVTLGQGADAFEQEVAKSKELVDELLLWRKRGPIGKLHNITISIMHNSERREEFYKIQRDELTTGSEDIIDGSQDRHNLIRDVDTRWNSLLTMCERGYFLRNSIDTYIYAEKMKYQRYLAYTTELNKKRAANKQIKPKAPSSIIADLLSPEEWDTVTKYIEILLPFREATKRLEGRADGGKFYV